MKNAPILTTNLFSEDEAFQNAMAFLKEQAKKKKASSVRRDLLREERRRCRAIATRKWIGGLEL